jgi:hypothetical protein
MLSSLPVPDLPLPIICTLLLLAIIVLPVVYSVIRATLSPLRSIPGPHLARYSRLWYLRAVRRRDFQETNVRLHEEHGKLPSHYFIRLRLIYEALSCALRRMNIPSTTRML